MSCIGLPVVLRVGIVFTISLALLAVGLVHDKLLMQILCTVFGFLWACAGSWLLYRLAKLTDMCISIDPGKKAIMSAVRKKMRTRSTQLPPPSSGGLEPALLLEVTSRTMGAKLFGILITKQLVLTVGMRTCVYIPGAVVMLEKFRAAHL